MCGAVVKKRCRNLIRQNSYEYHFLMHCIVLLGAECNTRVVNLAHGKSSYKVMNDTQVFY